MSVLTPNEYEKLAEFAFSEGNPGYRPTVTESPDGDGVWDDAKKYAHISPKYMKAAPESEAKAYAQKIYDRSFEEAARVCGELAVPKEFFPGPDSTLRVLYYPSWASSSAHTDFDFFTLCMFRDRTEGFRYLDKKTLPELQKAREISPGIHFGELYQEVLGVKPTKHEVVGLPLPQKSAVFFVVPPHESVLLSGTSVGNWMAERKHRSRK